MDSEQKGKIIIDNDAGADDALAIFMALLYEKYFDGPKIIGLTTGSGNAEEDTVNINNQRILKVAKRQDVPIYRGLKSPLVTAPPSVQWFGADGLGDDDDEKKLEGLVPAHNKTAVDALIELSKIHEGNLTVITIGTLTNVAKAIKLDPNFITRLNHLYVGAGHIHDEVHSNPEFNAVMDVEAYHIVVQNATPDKVTLFPFSTTRNTLKLSKEWRSNIFGTIDTDIVRALNKYERVSFNKSVAWDLLDPSVVAVALKPNLIEKYDYSKNSIVVDAGEKRGLTTHEIVPKKDANVKVILKVKADEYQQFLLDLFSAELHVPNQCIKHKVQ